MARPELPSWLKTASTSILANVATAALLFVGALIFKPQVYDLLSPPDIPQYPLVCYAEPRPGGTPSDYWVEFFIVSQEQEPVDRADLQSTLRTFRPNDMLTPDLRLDMEPEGRIEEVVVDASFNQGKGSIRAEKAADERSATIRIMRVEQWAIMRVDLHFTDMLGLGEEPRRMAKFMVPFPYEDLQDGCFQV